MVQGAQKLTKARSRRESCAEQFFPRLLETPARQRFAKLWTRTVSTTSVQEVLELRLTHRGDCIETSFVEDQRAEEILFPSEPDDPESPKRSASSAHEKPSEEDGRTDCEKNASEDEEGIRTFRGGKEESLCELLT